VALISKFLTWRGGECYGGGPVVSWEGGGYEENGGSFSRNLSGGKLPKAGRKGHSLIRGRFGGERIRTAKTLESRLPGERKSPAGRKPFAKTTFADSGSRWASSSDKWDASDSSGRRAPFNGGERKKPP